MFEQCIQMFEMLYNLLKMRIRFNAKSIYLIFIKPRMS